MRPIIAPRGWPAYILALAVVAAGFGARSALNPVLGSDHAYTVFYPGVILAAYFLGARPAAVTAVLSAAAGYWFFAHPVLHWKVNPAGLTTLSFFALTATVSVYFITGMGRALKALAAERARAEGLARNHATLFQELNERVTNHLQLVAALLQVQARDARDVSLSVALAEASSHTLSISRVHRSLSGEGGEALDFDAFARQLVDITLAARGNGDVRIELQSGGLRLAPDQATSVAVVLLECLNARLDAKTPAALRIALRGDERELVLEIRETGGLADPLAGGAVSRHVIEAMAEQLGGRFSVGMSGDGAVSLLAFPRLDGQARAAPPVRAFAAPTLH